MSHGKGKTKEHVTATRASQTIEIDNSLRHIDFTHEVPFEITLDNKFKIPFTFLYILLLSTMLGKCDSVSISITFPLKASQWVVRLKLRFCL